MENNLNLQLVEFCGESAVNFISKQIAIEKQIQEYEENNEKLVQQIKELTKTWKEMSLGSASTANEGSSYIGGNTSNKFTKKGRRTKSSFK